MNWLTSLMNLRRNWKDSFIPWRFLHVSPQFNDYGKDQEKIKVIFTNPALLKVFCLQCDLFSMARVKVYNKAGNEVANDSALDRIANPNPYQSQSQWLWDYMFWKMVGNANLYMDSNVVERDNAPMYWLENQKIRWPLALEKHKDRLVFSQSQINKIMDMTIEYVYDDGSVFKFPLRKLCTITDLTNGTGNFFKGFSRIDALTKIIDNSERSLDSKNINVRYAGKFLVAGAQDVNDVTKTPLGEEEKKDIEKSTNSEKDVHAVKSMIEIKRFVDDLRVLELDKSYLADYYLIGTAYNIPRDVLEAYTSSTFENQEKARAGHITYTLDPAGDVLGTMLAKRWQYKPGWRICLSWDHLPVAQVYEKEKANLHKIKIDTMNLMIKIGIPIEEINIFLSTNFTVNAPKPDPKVE